MYNMNEVKKVVKDFLESIKEKIFGMDNGEIDYNGEIYNELMELFEEVREIYRDMRAGDIGADGMELVYSIIDGDFDELVMV